MLESRPKPKFAPKLRKRSPSNKLLDAIKQLDEKAQPGLPDLTLVRRIISHGGLDKNLYQVLLGELEEVQDHITNLDIIISSPAPQDWGTANAMYDALDGQRLYLASLTAYYESEYERSKKSFWLDKGDGTERYRERYQDAGSAPYVFLLRKYDERLKTMDKKMVRLNKILERENILTNRGSA